jgi:DNA-binding transcriptional regulator LsrR (DeoR family)
VSTDPKIDQLAKIARLYFLEEINQRDIAARLGISLAGVSRSLSRARELGIVKITVGGPGRELAELEIAVEKSFGLRECLLTEPADSLEVMASGMAAKAGLLLERILPSEAFLGISWGRTLKYLGEHLPDGAIHCAAVVPIIGAVGTIETGIYPNGIARDWAARTGADSYLVNTPGIVDNGEVKASVTGDRNFRQVAELWDRLDAILFGVSSLDEGTTLRSGRLFSPELLDDATRKGAVAAVNFNFIDAGGRPVSTGLEDRIVNLDLQGMDKVGTRILAAAGKVKAPAIKAALTGRLAHILITDAETARLLL